MKTYQEFDDTDWDNIAKNWHAWWEGTLDRPLFVIEAVDYSSNQKAGAGSGASSLKVRDLDGFITRFPLSVPVDEILDEFEPNLRTVHYALDGFPKWWPNLGPGVMAGFLGSRVEFRPGTTWFHDVGVSELADLQLSFDNGNAWWHRVLTVTEAAVARWGDKIAIGHTDLGGNLDILASLRGTESLLLDLLDVPEVVDRCVDEITKLWIEYYEALYSVVQNGRRGVACWAPCWQPSRGYMLQCDFSYMISPSMFARWVTPDLTRLSDFLDYGFYHMDGPGQLRHLDALISIPNLRGIQWIPGAGSAPPEEWPDLLRKILDAGKRCQVYVTPAGARKLLDELDCRGMLIVLREDNGERNLSVNEAELFIDDIGA